MSKVGDLCGTEKPTERAMSTYEYMYKGYTIKQSNVYYHLSDGKLHGRWLSITQKLTPDGVSIPEIKMVEKHFCEGVLQISNNEINK